MEQKRIIDVAFIIKSLRKGGAEKQLYVLLKGLDRSAYRPVVIAYVDGFWRRQIENLDVPVKIVSSANKAGIFVKTFRHIRKSRPIIVHTIGHYAGFIGRAAAFVSRIPVVVASERTAPSYEPISYAVIERFLCKHTNRIICNAHHSALYYRENGLARAHQIVVIPNGIDIADYPQVSLDQPNLSVGYIANFKSIKNHLMLIRAAQRVHSVFPDARFHLAGDGKERKLIENEIEAAGLQDSFILHGLIDDVKPFLREINLYVHVSLYEGLSNAVMEAMASGVPCIATRTSGNLDLIEDGQTGLLSNVEDAKDIAETIIKLGRDPEARKNFGMKGRMRIAEEFSSDKMVTKTMNVYGKEIRSYRTAEPYLQ